MKTVLRSTMSYVSRIAVQCLLVGYAGAAIATDIANAPLFTSSNTQVKPNIMFILDESGSMAWDYLPDVSNFPSAQYGKKSYQCNGVAYNPNVVYSPPLNADGSAQPNASVAAITPDPTTQTTSPRTANGPITIPLSASGSLTVTLSSTTGARSSWYGVDSIVTIYQTGDSARFFTGTVTSWTPTTGKLVLDLSTSYISGAGVLTPVMVGTGSPNPAPFYYRYTGSEPQLSYTYTSAGVVTSTTFYKQCSSNVGSTPGSNVFTQVNVTAASAEAQNYANWALYYNTRIKMMKTSITRAFKGIDSRYRIGYTTIHNVDATPDTTFLDINDFDATQKASFYTSVNAANPANSTPLRGSLSLAGRYFAHKAQNQASDPMQYSCQRNFAILSTDGYWNTPNESPFNFFGGMPSSGTTGNAQTNFGPFQLDNLTVVGQQDGGATLRPMYDGGSVTVTTKETWTSTAVTPRTDTTSSTRTDVNTTYTTQVTPKSGGAKQRNTDVLLKSLSVAGSSITYSGNTVTVTGTVHNLTSGDLINVSGGSNSTLRGTNLPVTRVSDTSFSYVLPSNPSASVGSTAYTMTPSATANAFCSAGTGVKRTWLQTSNADLVTNLTTTTNTTPSTSTVTVTTTTVTPYTRTIIVTNGVQTSDTTSPGAPSTTSSSSAPSVTTGTTTSSSSTTQVSSTSGAGGVYVNTNVVSTGSTCSSSAAGPGSSTSIAATTYTGPVSSSSNTAAGTSSTPGTTTTTESTHNSSSNTTTNGGSSNSLADVAMYYYNTDLRTPALGNCTGALGTDVCTNNVPGSTASAQQSFGDSAAWQHMTTFTLGLGVGGLLKYDPNYLTQTSGDFVSIINRTKDWPVPPESFFGGPENVDDLWHAAVDGRGRYFSALDPTSLANSLTQSLAAIQAVTGAAAAASTSSLQPVQGDNDVFVAQFTSVKWVGDVLSYRIDPTTGQISTTPVWSAKAQLDATAPSARTIYYPNPSGGSTLRTFTWANLSTDNYGSNFTNFCSKSGAGGAGTPSQCASLGAADLTNANMGSNLVNFLRGDQTMTYYRQRDSMLGDIISASPLFVGKPQFKYTENNYATFASNNVNRQAVVLAAANDGMVHAFDRTTGNELWAYMPSFVLSKLYVLADFAYSTNHTYFVDGSPQSGDIYVNGAWKTIVVGGMNAGGRGYYALDVTNPVSPKFLWEFSENDLGLTFGNPVITKRADGTWIVAFTSGYNNVNPGDGNGHLYIVNANTGALLDKIDTKLPDGTNAGNTTTPNGLSKLNLWVDDVTNNTAKRFYSGDLVGNLWRFDLDNLVAPNHASLQIAKLTSPDGTPQSITTKPGLAQVLYNGFAYPVVLVGTGRYLGTSDASTSSIQSVYAIKDAMTGTGLGVARSNSGMVAETITATTTANGTAGRSIATSSINWTSNAGWYADFPVGGERVTVNPQLTLSTLTVGTVLPSNTACTVGGESFLYMFNFNNGGSATNAPVNGVAAVGSYVGNVLIQGLTTVQLKAGTESSSIVTITTRSDATLQTTVTAAPVSASNLRRTSWRELVD